MIKRISLVSRTSNLTHDQFVQHWLGPHADIVRRLPKLRGMRLNVVEDPDAPWDGIGELWFDSMEDAREAFETEPFKSRLAADRPAFLARNEVYWVAEHTLISPPVEGPSGGR